MAVSARLRFEVLRRDGYRCRYCGTPASEQRLTVDHVMPVTLGGSDDLGNLVACCPECNAGKSSSLPELELVDKVAREAAEWEATKTRFERHANAELDAVLSVLESRFHDDADGDQNDHFKTRFANQLRADNDVELSDRAYTALASAWRVARAFWTYTDTVNDVLRSYPVGELCDAADYVRTSFPEVEQPGASVAEYRWYLIVTLLKNKHAGHVHRQPPPELYKRRYPQLDFMERFVELAVQKMGADGGQQEIMKWCMWSVASKAFDLYHFTEASNAGPDTQLKAFEATLCEIPDLFEEALNDYQATLTLSRPLNDMSGED